jgi:chromosome segregation ATPase
LDITELPTGEYPALSEGDDGHLSATAELQAVQKSAPKQDEADKASFWLAHLEAEVTRLHAKWQCIDAEFKNREARAAELQQEIAARDATIAQLTAAAQREAASLAAADERLASKDAELVALAEDRRARDERIAALSTELADAEVKHHATLSNVDQAEVETARLNGLLQQEQAATADAAQRERLLLAEQDRLHGKLQDLEIYINGRHDSWSELNAQLAQYKDALAGMEQTVQAREAVNTRSDDDKRLLAAKIQELEHQCSELAGRRKEREEANDELQRRLAGHFAEMEQLKLEHANRLNELEQAATTALNGRRYIEALEADIKSRTARIQALDAEAQQGRGVIGELTSANSDLAGRVAELDKSLAVQHDLVASLTAELRAKQAAADVLERSVDRITDLGASLAALDKEMHGGDGERRAANGGAEELLPIDLLLDDEFAHDAGQRAAVEARRKLVITIGGEAIQYPIVKNLMTIGRGHESDIRIASHFVSRVHAKISTSDMGTIIEDAGSKNGVLVNSERVKRRVLHHGDVVSIGGELSLRFVDAMH